jgi:O-acetyl-ADP-ribose deacetylase (regulator of RNase III)
MQIELLRADVQSIKLDAMVAPAESHIGVPSGSPAVVSGGNLLARFVIHVKVPEASESDADAKLRQATLDGLEKAEELAVASVGFPPIGIVCGFAAELCARVMLGAVLEHASRARSLQRTVFCLFGREEHELFKRVLGELERS